MARACACTRVLEPCRGRGGSIGYELLGFVAELGSAVRSPMTPKLPLKDAPVADELFQQKQDGCSNVVLTS